MSITRKLIRVDGTETVLVGPHALRDIAQMIGADTLDVVMLRHMGKPLHTMLVDDEGAVKGSAVNEKATTLYHLNCVPGTTWEIHGDVVIVPDGDFAEI
ncbi:MAG: hypothetical protein GX086_05925 [Alcaligenaceae bacterium]|nr:hypothetical protein [Alcaligenaceae bacterium]